MRKTWYARAGPLVSLEDPLGFMQRLLRGHQVTGLAAAGVGDGQAVAPRELLRAFPHAQSYLFASRPEQAQELQNLGEHEPRALFQAVALAGVPGAAQAWARTGEGLPGIAAGGGSRAATGGEGAAEVGQSVAPPIEEDGDQGWLFSEEGLAGQGLGQGSGQGLGPGAGRLPAAYGDGVAGEGSAPQRQTFDAWRSSSESPPVQLLCLDRLSGLPVLRGAGHSLSATVLLVGCEVSFQMGLDEQAFFSGMDSFLRQRGFVLQSLLAPRSGGHGQLEHALAVYRHRHKVVL